MSIAVRKGRIPEISLYDLSYILFRHKWKVILFFTAVFTTVAVLTFLTPSIYRSEAMILVHLPREGVTLDPTVTTGHVIPVVHYQESETSNELQVLKSQELVEKVVDKIGVGAFSEDSPRGVAEKTLEAKGFSKDRSQIIASVMKSLKIEMLKGSNIIHLSYEGPKPKFNQDILAQLIDFYLEKHIAIHRRSGSYDFFSNQTDQLRSGLQKMEENLRRVKNRTGIASLEDQRRVLLSRISDLQKEMELTDSGAAASKAKILTMEKTLSDIPQKTVTGETGINYGMDLMRAKLYDLKLREQDILSKYTEKSVPVQEIRRQIAEAEALIAKEEASRTQITKGPNEAYKQAEMAIITEKGTLSSLEAKSKALKGQLAYARDELKTLNDHEVQMSELQREINLQEASYRKYSQNLEQARVDQALETKKVSNISVVQPPTYPLRPVRPRKSLNLALGLILGVIGGIGLAFFSEHIDQRIRRPEDVEERLKLPILAAIPHSSERIGILETTTKTESDAP